MEIVYDTYFINTSKIIGWVQNRKHDTGKNMDQLAEDVGVTKATLYKLMQGDLKFIHLATLRKLTKAMGVTPNDLLILKKVE